MLLGLSCTRGGLLLLSCGCLPGAVRVEAVARFPEADVIAVKPTQTEQRTDVSPAPRDANGVPSGLAHNSPRPKGGHGAAGEGPFGEWAEAWGSLSLI